MGPLLLSMFSPESLSWGGFVILILAMLGEVGVYVIPPRWEALHGAAVFGFAALAVAGYAIERVGDDAITANEIAAIESRMNRVITPEKHAQIVGLLKDAPKGNILVDSASMDAEASQFGDEIVSVLKDAGFNATVPSFGDRAMSFTRTGAWFAVKDAQNPPPQAAPIWKAFKQAGFTFTGHQDATVPDAQTLVIDVSSHP